MDALYFHVNYGSCFQSRCSGEIFSLKIHRILILCKAAKFLFLVNSWEDEHSDNTNANTQAFRCQLRGYITAGSRLITYTIYILLQPSWGYIGYWNLIFHLCHTPERKMCPVSSFRWKRFLTLCSQTFLFRGHKKWVGGDSLVHTHKQNENSGKCEVILSFNSRGKKRKINTP